MIKILIKTEENQVRLLEVKGHAKSAPLGKDLICAAVSAVVTGGFNAIQDVDNFHFILQEGHASIEAKGPISSHDEIVIETIIASLRTIAEESPDFVTIKNL